MLNVKDLIKHYAASSGGSGIAAVDNISFHVKRGDFFTLLGPSGCGKTTTLQCIAGLEIPTSGEIEMDGKVVFCSRRQIVIPPNRRKLGMIFQSYAIWPHKTVYENVAFPLMFGERKFQTADIRKRAMQALELVKLADFADRPSPFLSGGQQQRVALARAIVHEPGLLLLDEPLSNLDAKLRDTMRIELRQLVKTLNITTVFVTHDQVEAMSMSDRIVLMRSGVIVQQGTPREIYLRPDNAFTAEFMGRSNLFPGTVGHRLPAGTTEVATPFGILECEVPETLPTGSAVFVVIRPQAVIQHEDEILPGQHNRVLARVRRLHFLGDTVEAEMSAEGVDFRVMLDPYQRVEEGMPLHLEFAADRSVVISRSGRDAAEEMTPLGMAQSR